MPPTLQSSNPPILVLGTAMWGWTTPKATAFAMLDEWYVRGFREVDTATNYPINKNPEQFRLAENILSEWIKAHGISDLEVMMKIGSVNNLRTPEHILTKSFILMMLDEYGYMFGENLGTLMVHWDNREDEGEINETFEALNEVENKGIKLGLSGIKYPDLYAKINKEYGFDFRIQIKHNLFFSDYGKYKSFHGKNRFIAYGINAGGLKLDVGEYSEHSSLKARGGNVSAEPEIMPKLRGVISEWNAVHDFKINNFNQIGMIYAHHQKDMAGILLGTSKVGQLKASVDFWEDMRKGRFAGLYSELMHRQIIFQKKKQH